MRVADNKFFMENGEICMNESNYSKFDMFFLTVMFLLGLSSCVSEAMARNCVRVLLLLTIARCILEPEILGRLQEIKSLLIGMGAFFAVMYISAYYGGHFSELMDASMFSLQYTALVVPACILLLQNRNHARMLVYAVYASMIVTVFYLFSLSLSGEFRPGTLLSPGVMISTCLFAILIPAMVASAFDGEASLQGRIFSGVCAAISLIGLICTNTRGAWLAIFPLVFVMLLYYIPGWKKKLMMSLVCGVLTAAVLVCFPSVMSRADTIVHSNEQQSATERLMMWQSATRMGLDHPVLGVGKLNYAEHYQNDYIFDDAKERTATHAHSNFFMMLGENGFSGMLTYCAMVGVFLAWGWKRRKNVFGAMVLFSTLGFVLYGVTDYTLTAYSAMRVYWLLMGLCVSYVYLSEAK